MAWAKKESEEASLLEKATREAEEAIDHAFRARLSVTPSPDDIKPYVPNGAAQKKAIGSLKQSISKWQLEGAATPFNYIQLAAGASSLPSELHTLTQKIIGKNVWELWFSPGSDLQWEDIVPLQFINTLQIGVEKISLAGTVESLKAAEDFCMKVAKDDLRAVAAKRLRTD